MTANPSHERLPPLHLLLALIVVAIWGTNFVVIKEALHSLPPLLFATLRFFFALIPACFFVRRPAVPWTNLAAYGCLIGVGQFAVLYLAMRADISPGLASLVVQMQVFFTVLLAVKIQREQVRLHQWAGLLLAGSGIVVIAMHTDSTTTVKGLSMVLFAAFCWASGNIVGKRAGRVNMIGYVVWSSMYAIPPLLLLSLLFEGPDAMLAGVRGAGLGTWAAVLWQSIANTLFGYGLWAWLLSRHPAATIAPMALLVPIFGMGASALWMGEPLPSWKVMAALLVISGLALNLLWPRLRRRFATP